MIRKIVSCITTVLLLISLSNVYVLAIGVGTNVEHLETDIKQECESFFSHQEMGNVIVHSLDNADYVQLKTLLQKSKIANSDINRFIFKKLGYTDKQIEAIGQDEIDYIMSTSTQITVQEMYVKIDADGKQEVIGKNDCIQELLLFSDAQCTDSQVALNTTSNNAENEVDESGDDGYMRILTRSDYIDPASVGGEKGWYNFSATFEWLTIPVHRGVDAFSLYASGTAWGQGETDTFSSVFVSYLDYNNNWQTDAYTKRTEDRTVASNGLWYEWKLLNDEYVEPMKINNRYQYFEFYIRGKARMTNYASPQAFNVFARYEHNVSYFCVNPTFGWTTGGLPGVTITGSFSNSFDTYSGYNYTHYDPNI